MSKKTCEKCIHHDVCRKPLEYSADPETCWKYEEPRPHGEWRDYSDMGFVECPFCEYATTCDDNIEELHYCFFCGASMSANDEQVTGKLNSEIEKSKSEIVPDFRDGWILKEGEKE